MCLNSKYLRTSGFSIEREDEATEAKENREDHEKHPCFAIQVTSSSSWCQICMCYCHYILLVVYYCTCPNRQLSLARSGYIYKDPRGWTFKFFFRAGREREKGYIWASFRIACDKGCLKVRDTLWLIQALLYMQACLSHKHNKLGFLLLQVF